MKKKNYIFVLGLSLILLFLAGCSNNNSNIQTGTTSEIANPASVYCINHGGNLTLEKNDSIGICHFKNGKFCEEWAYYRGNCSSE